MLAGNLSQRRALPLFDNMIYSATEGMLGENWPTADSASAARHPRGSIQSLKKSYCRLLLKKNIEQNEYSTSHIQIT